MKLLIVHYPKESIANITSTPQVRASTVL